MSGRLEELLGPALEGDASIFVAVASLLEQHVYAYFRRRRVSAEDAEDRTQAVFMVLPDGACPAVRREVGILSGKEYCDGFGVQA